VAAAGQAPSLPLACELAAKLYFLGWRFMIATGFVLAVHAETPAWLHQKPTWKADWRWCVLCRGNAGADQRAALYAALNLCFPNGAGRGVCSSGASIHFRRPVGTITWLAVGISIAGIAILSLPNPEAVRDLAGKRREHRLRRCRCLVNLDHARRGAFHGADSVPGPLRQKERSRAPVAGHGLPRPPLICVLIGAVLGRSTIYNGPTLAAILSDRNFLWPLLSLAFVQFGRGVHLQNSYQPLISPGAGLRGLLFEPVFATLFSVLFCTEKLTFTTVAGGAVILAAVLLVSQPRAETKYAAGG